MSARVYVFPSKSEPGTFHETTVHPDGRVECACKAGQHGKRCWHVEHAQQHAAAHTANLPVVTVPSLRVWYRVARLQYYDDVGAQWNEVGSTKDYAEAWLGYQSACAVYGAENSRLEMQTTVVIIGAGATV